MTLMTVNPFVRIRMIFLGEIEISSVPTDVSFACIRSQSPLSQAYREIVDIDEAAWSSRNANSQQ
jgi:hypothetical protein